MCKFRSILLGGIVVFAFEGFATKMPECGSDSIHRDCKFFEENADKPFIEIAPGVKYSNPAYRAPKSKEFTGIPKLSNPAQLQMGLTPPTAEQIQKGIEYQAKVVELLDGSRLPAMTRVALTQNFDAMISVDMAKKSGTLGYGDDQFGVPWPLHQRNAEVQFKTAAEVLSEVRKIIPQTRRAQFDRLVKERVDPKVQQYSAFQAQQAEKIKQDEIEKKKAEKQTALQNERYEKAKELFERARQDVIKSLKQGRSDSSLSPTEIEMIERIKSLKLSDPKSPWILSARSCNGDPLTAFYEPRNATVNLCSSTLSQTDGALLFILAHEIGHSIDPCNFQMESWKVDRQKLESFMAEYPKSEGVLGDQDRNTLKTLVDIKADQTHYSLDLMISDTSLIEKLTAHGANKKTKEFTQIDKYPLKTIYSCIQDKGGFRDTQPADHQKTIDILRSNIPPSTKDRKVYESRFGRKSKALQDYPQCFKAHSHYSQMGEVMCDVFGSVILEKEARDNPPATEAEIVGWFPFSHEYCPRTAIEGALSPISMQMMVYGIGKTHPTEILRTEHIHLSLPGIAKRLKCTNSQISCFESLRLNGESQKTGRSTEGRN